MPNSSKCALFLGARPPPPSLGKCHAFWCFSLHILHRWTEKEGFVPTPPNPLSPGHEEEEAGEAEEEKEDEKKKKKTKKKKKKKE